MREKLKTEDYAQKFGGGGGERWAITCKGKGERRRREKMEEKEIDGVDRKKKKEGRSEKDGGVER